MLTPHPPKAATRPPRIAPETKMAVSRAPRTRIAPGARKLTLLAKAGHPAWLKMDTADPNVVILWQLNEDEKAETP